MGERGEVISRRLDMVLGLATLALLALGVVGTLAAFIAWSDDDWTGGGACLIAAVIALASIQRTLAR